MAFLAAFPPSALRFAELGGAGEGFDWMPVVGTLLGAALGWVLAFLQNLVTERRRARRAVETAAVICLEQLERIGEGLSAGRGVERADLAALRAGLVGLRDAIAGCRSGRSRLLELHRTLVRVADAPDPRSVAAGIGRLREMLDGG